MSSQLKAERSAVNPNWEGQVIWISLGKLGFQMMHGKGTFEDPKNQELKNKWVKHVMLQSPEQEVDGVHLVPVPGVDGVRCLAPEGILGMGADASQVFKPVAAYLDQLGYTCGVDYDAVPYDWRFAPSVMERRDRYFESVCKKAEQMNKGAGVVLLGHSMGNKTVQYFLEYARSVKGQTWVDHNVYSWVAAGAPTLGAPQALRCGVQGMQEVVPLFTLSEAIIFARGLSATPWLFPIGAQVDVPCHYLRRQGVLEVRGLRAQVPGCGVESSRNKIMLRVDINFGAGRDQGFLTSKSHETFDGTRAAWNDEGNVLIFGGPADLPPDATISITMNEKGIHDDEERNLFKRFGKQLVAGAQIVAEASKGRKTLGVPRASTDAMSLLQALQAARPGADGFVDVRVPFNVRDQANNFVTFQVRWLDWRTVRNQWLGSQELARPGYQAPCKHNKNPGEVYEALDMKQLLRMESPEVLEVFEKYYGQDSLYNETGLNDCPPCRRVLAVHGVNVKTEVKYALRVNTLRVRPGEIHTKFVLDDAAVLLQAAPGVSMSGGIVYEEKGGPLPAGDGVVPLCSMEHCNEWSRQIEVKVERIEGCLHAPLLGDQRFLEILRHALAHDRSPAGVGKHLLRAGFEGVGRPEAPRATRWQAAKDASQSAWWDCPPEVSAQLTAARSRGQVKVQVYIGNAAYDMDLRNMVQRNLKTGMERALRVVAG